MVHISLFDGIAGFGLAAEAVGWTVGASSEIDPFCQRVLRHHFPKTYHHGDIHTLTYETIDAELSKRFGDWRRNGVILTGGFPCQGFSTAGKRAGTNDDRYLWPQMLRLIQEIRPDWIVGENVAGILSMEDESGLRREVFAQVEGRKITRYADFDHYESLYTRQAPMLVTSIIEDLEKEGYEVQTFVIPAASVGAPHKRDRIWFVAHADSKQCERRTHDRERPDTTKESAGMDNRPPRPCDTKDATDSNIGSGQEYGLSTGREVPQDGADAIRANTDAGMQRQQGERGISIGSREGEFVGDARPDATDATGERIQRNRPNREQEPRPQSREGLFGRDRAGDYWSEWPTQPPLCTKYDGLPGELADISFSKWREQSIKALGNAIVPQVAYEIFRAIEKVK